jgi:hypothetical protein
VLSCIGRGLWRWTDPPPKESYQISKGSISKKEKSDASKRHKENEEDEEEEEEEGLFSYASSYAEVM